MGSSDDRRTGDRVRVHTHVYIVPDLRSGAAGRAPADGPTTFDATTVNVSHGGAFVESMHIPRKGDTLIMVFLHPSRRNPIVLQGSVVWQNYAEKDDQPVGFGVQFTFTSDEQQKTWLEFHALIEQSQQ